MSSGMKTPVPNGSRNALEIGTTQPSPTPRQRAQSRLLELERYIYANERILMFIAPGAGKHILPHIVRFNQVIGVYCFLVLDFNDQATNRFVEHQMLSTFKEFKGFYQRSILTIIAAVQSRFYNDSMSSLRKEFQPTPDGSQPLSRDVICDTVLDRRPGYSKGLGLGPKPKFCKTANASNASNSCSQSMVEL
ncbi:CACTA en-spm transposon protein [Cucumis melo var. makuwa]|uniref:CACTA en-spm transposon protein n=1 Tax=Cucumis melo var. makuwa TaxID=1194695 RepID=A0A5A7TTU3_CUCMM|nr:CACTA en-spm transposon protein [Cucumis melo var. makuwa]TYJ97727.1 CACTA en-spm transposon protein [Cucumis melo var. makuwa]